MAVALIQNSVTPQDITIAREDYGDYVKIVVDIATETIAIGGEWHADAEKILLDQGSLQENIWGGGIDLTTSIIETVALINIRPRYNNDSQEIIDPSIRSKFIAIVKRKFNL